MEPLTLIKIYSVLCHSPPVTLNFLATIRFMALEVSSSYSFCFLTCRNSCLGFMGRETETDLLVLVDVFSRCKAAVIPCANALSSSVSRAIFFTAFVLVPFREMDE